MNLSATEEKLVTGGARTVEERVDDYGVGPVGVAQLENSDSRCSRSLRLLECASPVEE